MEDTVKEMASEHEKRVNDFEVMKLDLEAASQQHMQGLQKKFYLEKEDVSPFQGRIR